MSRMTALQAALTDAARDVIASSGHEALRARALAETAGCSLGQIYNAFPDLDALVYSVKAQVLTDMGAAVARAAAQAEGARDPVEALATMGVAYVEFALANRNLWRMLFNHRPAGEDGTPAWYQEHLATILSGIDGPLAAAVPGLAGRGLSDASRTLFSAVHGVVTLGVQERFGPTPRRAVEESVRLLVRSFVAGLRTVATRRGDAASRRARPRAES